MRFCFTRHLLMNVLLILMCVAVDSNAEELASGAESWPRWRGADMTGHSPSTGLLKDWESGKPQLLWKSEGTGEGYASLAIVGDTIYTTGNFPDGQAVVALDVDGGKVKWKRTITGAPPKHGYPGARSTPTLDADGHVYVVSSEGSIVCLNATDGEIVWSKSFADEYDGKMMSGWGFSESPLVDEDRVVFTPGGSEAAIVALNRLTGDEIWRCSIPQFGSGENVHGHKLKSGAGYSSIVISNGGGVKHYVQQVGEGVVGVRASDGRFLWGSEQVANPTANISTPIVDGDHVFYSNAYGAGSELLKLSAYGDGGVKAEQSYVLKPAQLQNHHGGMVLHEGYIYTGHKKSQGFPVCVELATGTVKWGGRIRGAGGGSAAIVFADGNLIFRYQDGTVALVEANPEEYVLKGTFMPVYQEKESWAHPVVLNQKLYLREQNVLMCYDLSGT